jgi:hypothetical protein
MVTSNNRKCCCESCKTTWICDYICNRKNYNDCYCIEHLEDYTNDFRNVSFLRSDPCFRFMTLEDKIKHCYRTTLVAYRISKDL